MATSSPAPHPIPGASLLPRAAAAAVIASAVLVGHSPGALAQIGGGVGEPVGGGNGAKPPTAEAASSSSIGIILAVVGGVVVLVAVAAVVALVAGRSRRAAPVPSGTAPTAPAAPAPAFPMTTPEPAAPTDDRSARERDRLVQVLVDVGDQLDSVALAAWVTQALAEVGVAEVVVDGQRFDSSRHQAVEHVATTDPAADGIVARTSQRGFVDRDRVVRPPQVLVYRYQAAS